MANKHFYFLLLIIFILGITYEGRDFPPTDYNYILYLLIALLLRVLVFIGDNIKLKD